jgi:hypothetical protein
MTGVRGAVLVAIWGLLATCALVNAGPFTWMQRDTFDTVMDKLFSVTADNCSSKPQEELELPMESVAQIPVYNTLWSPVIYQNRSSLLHMHNMALNRAFFYSLIYQKLNNSAELWSQPGLRYLYMSSTADVTASPGFINGSSLYFDHDCFYPPNYVTRGSLVYGTHGYNTTLLLYASRVWRSDDHINETAHSGHWLRESTNNTVDIKDYAAGRMNNFGHIWRNYTNPPWYSKWMPDAVGGKDSLRKYAYSVGIKFSNKTGYFMSKEFFTTAFYGPPQPGQTGQISLPVLFTKPYFDCGRSNKWILSASSPVVDYMPRYSRWIHLRRAR